MLTTTQLHPYQVRAINHVVHNPHSALWVDMGLGKTVIALSAFSHMKKHGAVRGCLIVGPLRVVQSVWERESSKWEHTQGLSFSLIHGEPQIRLGALLRTADCYLVNYENIVWLVAQLQHYYINKGLPLPFDMIIFDEVSKMKRHNTKRMRAVAQLLPAFSYRVGLTGTPASNGLEDLFGQFIVVDGGQRLGTNYHQFLHRYFKEEGYGGYKHRVTPEGEREIHARVSDIVLEMSQADYLTLPDLIVNDIYVNLQPQHRAQYEQLERQLFTELDNGEELEVFNEAAKTNKCLQFSNGAAYTNTETREWEPVHNAKLDALDDILEEAAGEQVLIAYNYRPDAVRILDRFPHAKNITGLSGAEFTQVLSDWQAGRQQILIGHPASMGHGIDGLQDSCHIMVWFGLNWSLELYLQFNARLHRQGQGRPVVCHRILTDNTLDDAVRIALEGKTQTQDALRHAVEMYRQQKDNP